MSLVQVQSGADAETVRRALGRVDAEIRFDAVSRVLYSTDASVYQIQPLGVVIPKTRAALIEIVKICHGLRCPITMRGGGTSQAGQAVGDGVVVDTSK